MSGGVAMIWIDLRRGRKYRPIIAVTLSLIHIYKRDTKVVLYQSFQKEGSEAEAWRG